MYEVKKTMIKKTRKNLHVSGSEISEQVMIFAETNLISLLILQLQGFIRLKTLLNMTNTRE